MNVRSGSAMMENAQKIAHSVSPRAERQRTYQEIVTYLQALPERVYAQEALDRTQLLDQALGSFIGSMETIVVAGTNGKSLSIDFASRLLRHESVPVAAVYSSYILHMQELVSINGEAVSARTLVETANEVIACAEQHGIAATRSELVFMIGMVIAHRAGVQVTLVEAGLGGHYDPSYVCNPVLTVVTRVADDASGFLGETIDDRVQEFCTIARKGIHFFSADQSKILLKKMKNIVQDKGALWVMPIRKVAALPYLLEQMYGRVAIIGERIAHIYVEEIKKQFSPLLRGNIVSKQQGLRGRPTRAALLQDEADPLRSLKEFWQEQTAVLPGRFQILDKELPSVVLDIAHNGDAFENVFLGIRLMQYQKQRHGFTIIMAIPNNIAIKPLLHSARYLMKKVPGQLLFVPVPEGDSYPLDELLAHAGKMYMRVRVLESVEAALAVARDITHPREGVVVLTGSVGVVREYWRLRDVRKLS
jgi:folylpolyglutamate synthase/dihydrofolate synthase